MNEDSRDIRILEHITDYCDQISEAVECFGADLSIFLNDRVYRNAVSLCILQIGELVSILTEEFEQNYSDIPWREIKLMRNIVAHRYGTIDYTITWDVVQNDIPKLKAFCSTFFSESLRLDIPTSGDAQDPV